MNQFSDNDTQESFVDKANFEEKILKVIHSHEPDDVIRNQLENYHANDIASILEDLDDATREKLYLILGIERTSEVFSYLDDAAPYLGEIGLDKSAAILEEMDADDAVDILEDLDTQTQEALISRMDEESKEDIHLIFSYEEDMIGSRMTTNYIAIFQNSTVKKAMRELIKQAEDNDNIDTIYVENEDGTFYGAIELKDLITARDYDNLHDIISTSYPYVLATEKVSDCIEELIDYSEDSIPVLNENKELIGVITSSDLVEAIDDEMSDDYAKLAGLTADEDLNEPLKASIKKRLPWLVLLLFMGIGVSSVVGLFEDLVSQIALIVSFQSLILGMAGNVGTQSLAVTIRVLMDENISSGQKVGFIFKEMRIGFLNGLLLGTLSFIIIGLFIWLTKGKPLSYAFAISLCVGLALLAAMVISSLVGTLVPICFHKVHIDPAIASGPLITTLNDLVAVVTYYGLSGFILINLLHITG